MSGREGSDDPDRAWLSPLLNKVAEIAGVRAALLLGREKGCQTVYIPRRMSPKHWLVKLVGEEAGAAIAAEYGGQKIDIPPALVGQKRRRRRAIADMTRNGYSINRTAASLGVARSTVKRHRHNLRGNSDDDGGTLL